MSYNPHEILVSERGFGVFEKKILFNAYRDYDFLTYILRELTEEKGFEVSSKMNPLA